MNAALLKFGQHQQSASLDAFRGDLHPPRVFKRIFIRLGFFLLISTGNFRAADWPEFRGPTGQGHATARNLPIEWGYVATDASKNIAWRQAIPGSGWSSPSLHRGKVYLTTAVLGGSGTNAGISLRALCVDAVNGKILWDDEVFNHPTVTQIHSKNGHASPTPLLEGERLYVHFGHQGTACLDLAGKILWRNTSLAYSPVHGFSHVPGSSTVKR